jgi:hypothetical protein
MTRKTKRRSVPQGEATGYEAAAVQFFEAAELAGEYEYWNAAGLLYVHAAIAFADAVAIARMGEKSTSENHLDAVRLLEESTSNVKGRDEAREHLRKIIDVKNTVAYNGDTFRRADLEKLALHAGRFRVFAERMLKA